MDNLSYYEDLRHPVLLAYDPSTEFFVQFFPEAGEWVDCRISFSQFKHDYEFREISREEALQKTGGKLPEVLFRQYMDILKPYRE